MPVDKGNEGREQRPPNDWERIETEKPARDAARKAWDATHEPSEEFEQAARPLPTDYGKDRPTTRTVRPDQAAEMVELWGQENVDRLIASGRIVVENDDRPGPPRESGPPPRRQGGDQDAHRPDAVGDTHSSDQTSGGDITRTTTGPPADTERRELRRDQRDGEQHRAETSPWDNVEGTKPDRANISVNESRQAYILDGNGRGGGGHLAGTGLPNKTEFPASWDDETVIRTIEGVARSPDYPPELQENGRWKVQGTRDGVEMTVIVNPDSEIYSGFPRRGRGVVHNDEYGNPTHSSTER